ncbi:prepilin-type N-terminal cleavage/methylation domain-containing protein [Mesorhizobium sp. J428]|uniref:prepilin-type N-terminal cleavage/methylation domain-containing protein n=1 Tax=Mesorhizobium sp. J428 TaxID=2898440 RepID=UPI002150FCC0|nr:prepilin-type N-terminal cleavage/methylation domain-containing protein [Mesorhizobium sp. J428]MCR5858794.1 prepilin-type N-terminal cleavage/methylation domain-containing protein [Mesorhizobium sp. J428]
MTRPSSSRDGFVLIEVLVALSVVAVMAGMMAGVFGQLNSVARLREQVIVRAELEGALSHLASTLSAAKLASLPDSEEENVKMFDGRATQMRFAAVTRQGFYSLALRDIDIYIDDQAAAPRLVQSMAMRRQPDAAEATRSTIIILDSFDRIDFTYSEDGVSFMSSFSKAGILPKLVKIRISRSVAGKTVSATTIARVS